MFNHKLRAVRHLKLVITKLEGRLIYRVFKFWNRTELLNHLTALINVSFIKRSTRVWGTETPHKTQDDQLHSRI